MAMHSITSFLALAAVVSGATTAPRQAPEFKSSLKISETSYGSSAGGKAWCLRGKISVTASATNTKLLIQPPASQAELTQTLVDMVTVNNDYATRVNGGPNPVSGTFKIYAELCVPKNPGSVETLQFLNHGSTLDHTYWDFAPGYSYVDAAVDAGYATFNYDRLGYGRSDRPDPNQVVQIRLQIEIAHILIQGLRNSSVAGKSIKKVVGVGHSAGSLLALGVVGTYPADFDGLVLTGISASVDSVQRSQIAFNLVSAASDPSGRFKGLNKGYLEVGVAPKDLQYPFYRYPDYDPAILQKQFDTREIATLGELLTFGTVVAPQPQFTGPVDVVLGQQDFLFCLADCTFPANQADIFVNALFPTSLKKGTYLQPKSGHLIAQHYTAKDGFAHSLNFLKQSGL